MKKALDIARQFCGTTCQRLRQAEPGTILNVMLHVNVLSMFMALYTFHSCSMVDPHPLEGNEVFLGHFILPCSKQQF